MPLLFQVLFALVLLVYYSILNTVKFFIPWRYRAKSIKNEIALVTGAGSGIGKLLAKKLAKEGAILVLWDIDEKSNENTKNEILDEGGKAFAYKCDVTSKDEIYRVAQQVKKEIGDVNILVNNAGIVSGKKLLELDDSEIERTFKVNTMAHFWTTRTFLPSMLEKNQGHIVTIASIVGMGGLSGLTDYSSSKFSAVGFHESLRNELIRIDKKGIQTTVVCPSVINTGLFSGVNIPYFPMMEPEYVSNKILQGILTNKILLCIPEYMYAIILMINLFPVQVTDFFFHIFGLNNGMDTFVGRKKD